MKDREFVEAKTEIVSVEHSGFKVKKENINDDIENSKSNITFLESCSSRIKDEYNDEMLSDEDCNISEIKEEDKSVSTYIAELSKNVYDDDDEKIDIKDMHFVPNEFDENKYTLEKDSSDDQRIFSSKQASNDHHIKLEKEATKSDLKNTVTDKNDTKQSTSISIHKKDRSNIICQFCNKCFTRKTSLDNHLLRQHKQKINRTIHACIMCSYQTAYKSALDKHFNTTHNEQKTKVNCKICVKSFSRKLSLDNHYLNEHKQEINGHLKSLITSKIHECNTCAYKTTYICNLNKHFNSFHNEQRIKINCQICDKSFLLKSSLDHHLLKKHKQEIKGNLDGLITSKTYKCNDCSYQTTHKHHLDKHINSMHNKLRTKVKCQICNKPFLSKSSLDFHMLKEHEHEMKSDLKSLIATKVYKCYICNKLLLLKRSLDCHLLSQHKEEIKGNLKSLITSKIYKCEGCSYQTTVKNWLDRHFNSVHNKEKNQN